jgi:hypothetical protein
MRLKGGVVVQALGRTDPTTSAGRASPRRGRHVKACLEACEALHDPTSGRWSGAYRKLSQSQGSFVSAQGRWTIPQIYRPAFSHDGAGTRSPPSSMSIWVGVGSSKQADGQANFVSAGVDLHVSNTGMDALAFFEVFRTWVPGGASTLESTIYAQTVTVGKSTSSSALPINSGADEFRVSAGDNIFVRLSIGKDAQTWIVLFSNVTQATETSVSISLPNENVYMDYAAWIVEPITAPPPEYEGPDLTFPVFGKVVFDDATCESVNFIEFGGTLVPIGATRSATGKGIILGSIPSSNIPGEAIMLSTPSTREGLLTCTGLPDNFTFVPIQPENDRSTTVSPQAPFTRQTSFIYGVSQWFGLEAKVVVPASHSWSVATVGGLSKPARFDVPTVFFGPGSD